MSNKVTLKDIAKMSGTSISTVSRVLNGNDEKAARNSIKDKIWKIAKENHYVPNKTAQNLKRGQVGHKQILNFGIIFARLDKDNYNPFFIKLSHVIHKEIISEGYNIKFTCFSDALRTSDANEFFCKNKVDGIIILGKFNDWLYDKIKNHIKCFVYVGLNKLLFRGLDQVIVDGRSAAITAVNYLYQIGHTNIMYLGETVGEQRYAGYVEAMNHFLGDHFNQKNIMQCRFTIASAYQAVKEKYDSQFTAIFCGNDEAGIGALQALTEMGYDVPRQVSVISIDNIDLLQNYTPLLTTVNIPLDEMGKMAVKMILQRINKERHVSAIVEFQYEIVKRETTRDLR